MTSLVTFGETSLRVQPSGEGRLDTASEMRMEASGVESNVAVAASQLGADATWLSKLPDSPLGHRVERQLHQYGIETDLAWGEGRQSLQFFENGIEPRTRRLQEDRADCAATTVAPGELPMDRVQAADGVFVGGSTLALSEQLVQTGGAVLRAGGGGGLTAFDLDYQPALWSLAEARETYESVFSSVDVLFASEGDARTVFDRSGKPREMAHSIASNGGFEMVVITRSEWGALVWHDNVIHELDSVETEVVDPSGQHEAFIGAFLERLLSDAPTDEALAYGVAAAALTRTLPGSMTTISHEETAALAEDIQDGR
jgi:2-dehydro-3-deoxygluconokinase